MKKGEIYRLLKKTGGPGGALLKVEEIHGNGQISGKICFPDGGLGEEVLSRPLLSKNPLTKKETMLAFEIRSDRAVAAIFDFFSEPKHGK